MNRRPMNRDASTPAGVMMPDTASFRTSYRAFLQSLPVDAVGVVRTAPSVTYRHLARILPALPPNLSYLARNAACRAQFGDLGVGASGRPQSVIACAVALDEMMPCAIENGFARYCVCGDYHKVLRDRLGRLCDFLSSHVDLGAYRICVDTAPILEREWAVRAGLGHIGFNHMLIHPTLGSHVMLGEILAEADLSVYGEILNYESNPINPSNIAQNAQNGKNEEEYVDYCEPGRIGCCPKNRRRCVQSCPTGALRETGYDASLCLSYWTTQHRGIIPDAIARATGSRLWGCDACQNTCPKVARAPKRPFATTPLSTLTFDEIFALSGKGLARRLAGTPLGDASPAMVVRNACIVLANTQNTAYNAQLARVAQTHPTDWVRETAARALRALRPLE